MMSENNRTSVLAAFEILLEEVEEEVDLSKSAGSEAIQSGDFQRARAAIERVERITAFRDQLAKLRDEWEVQESSDIVDEADDFSRSERRNLGRVPRGSRTPHKDFFVPILKVIQEHGGSAKASDVVDGIESLMQDTLKDVEYTPLASDPEVPRWRNRAHWARHQMVQEGLLKGDSERGIWEISERGKEFLSEQNSQN